MGLIRIVITIALLLTLAVRGIQKQSLSYSGAVAAVLLGGLTKFKSEVKKQLEEGHLEGGQRNAVQVLSNGLTGLVACCLHWYWSSIAAGDASAQAEWSVWIQVMLFAYIGHFASCNGDTWASATLQSRSTQTLKEDHSRLSNSRCWREAFDFEHISGIAVLDNHQINLFRSSLVAAVMAGAVGYWLGSSSPLPGLV
ncbi:hypothetical protein BASA60_008683 [Batrachochytrium salamandrivorans]|nr:hypothetical protein BASA60_008683 [Batrachochytrium salamandrivorans]